MKTVRVTTNYKEKQMQRALLQYAKPENADLVREALTLAGREELIAIPDFGEITDFRVNLNHGKLTGGEENVSEAYT